jgi:hypothetical protein
MGFGVFKTSRAGISMCCVEEKYFCSVDKNVVLKNAFESR